MKVKNILLILATSLTLLESTHQDLVILPLGAFEIEQYDYKTLEEKWRNDKSSLNIFQALEVYKKELPDHRRQPKTGVMELQISEDMVSIRLSLKDRHTDSSKPIVEYQTARCLEMTIFPVQIDALDPVIISDSEAMATYTYDPILNYFLEKPRFLTNQVKIRLTYSPAYKSTLLTLITSIFFLPVKFDTLNLIYFDSERTVVNQIKIDKLQPDCFYWFVLQAVAFGAIFEIFNFVTEQINLFEKGELVVPRTREHLSKYTASFFILWSFLSPLQHSGQLHPYFWIEILAASWLFLPVYFYFRIRQYGIYRAFSEVYWADQSNLTILGMNVAWLLTCFIFPRAIFCNPSFFSLNAFIDNYMVRVYNEPFLGFLVRNLYGVYKWLGLSILLFGLNSIKSQVYFDEVPPLISGWMLFNLFSLCASFMLSVYNWRLKLAKKGCPNTCSGGITAVEHVYKENEGQGKNCFLLPSSYEDYRLERLNSAFREKEKTLNPNAYAVIGVRSLTLNGFYMVNRFSYPPVLEHFRPLKVRRGKPDENRSNASQMKFVVPSRTWALQHQMRGWASVLIHNIYIRNNIKMVNWLGVFYYLKGSVKVIDLRTRRTLFFSESLQSSQSKNQLNHNPNTKFQADLVISKDLTMKLVIIHTISKWVGFSHLDFRQPKKNFEWVKHRERRVERLCHQPVSRYFQHYSALTDSRIKNVRTAYWGDLVAVRINMKHDTINDWQKVLVMRKAVRLSREVFEQNPDPETGYKVYTKKKSVSYVIKTSLSMLLNRTTHGEFIYDLAFVNKEILCLALFDKLLLVDWFEGHKFRIIDLHLRISPNFDLEANKVRVFDFDASNGRVYFCFGRHGEGPGVEARAGEEESLVDEREHVVAFGEKQLIKFEIAGYFEFEENFFSDDGCKKFMVRKNEFCCVEEEDQEDDVYIEEGSVFELQNLEENLIEGEEEEGGSN